MPRFLLLAIGTLLLTVGCSENNLSNIPRGDEVGGRIEVSPPQLQYGTLTEGEVDTKPFLITNVGEASLLVEELQVDGDLGFRLIDPPTDFLLPVGASQQVEVEFTPTVADQNTALVTVFSDDPLNPEEDVDLLGYGAVPELEIDPASYDFGAEFVGCGDDVEITLRNVGTEDLVIDGITYDEPQGHLVLDQPYALPITLSPGSEAPVWVDWQPGSEAAVEGRLDVSSNDPRGLLSASQRAEAIYGTVADEQFTVPSDPPVDILFAVDQSCSMDQHSEQLADGFDDLISEIATVTSGWQIGVATLDDGCFNSGVLDAYTPSLASTFASAVTQGSGTSYQEKLFRLTEQAMAQTSGCNAGFLRSNALLHVVVVSDEAEQSNISPASFVSTLRDYKPADDLVKVSGIVCKPSGCVHGNSPATAAGYVDAIGLTGGLRLDVEASTWGTYASQLAAASLSSIYRFELAQTPDPASIRVWVDGTEWTSDWHYDGATNEVVFDADPPEGGTVEVEYGVLVPCN